jgi:hypothetical protein
MSRCLHERDVLERLRAICDERGQAAVALELGTTRQKVYDYLTERRPLPDAVLEYLGVRRETVYRAVSDRSSAGGKSG